ncbi:LysE family translocator [Marinomonas sp.]|nr:LysE family translocator [Marinomonas sp.]MDB4837193.1 LysE family translocator [Marinomonas sp.]
MSAIEPLIGEHFIYYIMTCTLAAATPGPGTLAVLNSAITKGVRNTLPLMFGIIIGLGAASTLTLTGLSALILHSQVAFSVVQYLGGGYIGYLGIINLLPLFTPTTRKASSEEPKRNMTFYTGIVLSILSPKTLVFFTAFLPTFILQTESLVQQTILLTLVLLLCTFSIHLIYARLCGLIAHSFKQRMKWIDGITGVTFIAFAFIMLFRL